MNMVDRNCTFTLNMPIINIIDNRRQYPPPAQPIATNVAATTITATPFNVFNIQTFTNYNSNYTPPSPSTESNVNDIVNSESDLTELSWLTNTNLNFTNTNDAHWPNLQTEPPTIKQQNDNFIQTSITQQKLLKPNNLNNFSEFNGDLDSSFSSSASTSSSCSFTSSLNSSVENNENFAKFSANLQNIFKQQQQQKHNENTEHSYYNINDRTRTNKGISSVKKIKLSEYYENKDILKSTINNESKQISLPTSHDIKIEVDQQKINQPKTTQISETNNNLNKPPLTLSCLIFMAIQESKYKCLPVREIYEWIETNFPFYKNAKTGWKSSIRHNLSFSKCFKKMDRSESCKFLTSNNNNQNSNNISNTDDNQNNCLKFKLPTKTISNYNQRSTYITGTCWQVNPECKSYLMQTLKKSSFWFKYNKSYPNLTKLMQNYYNNEENFQQANSHHHHHHHHHNKNKINKMEPIVKNEANIAVTNESIKEEKLESYELKVNNEEMKEEIFNNSSSFNSSDNENENYFDDNEYENTKSNINYLNIDNDDDDVTKAAEILYYNKNLLLFKNHSTTISTPQILNKTNETKFISNINSDLEIEVASTLVRLKSLIEIRS